MEDISVSIEEMIEFIHIRCAGDISKDSIEMILDLQEEFLASKGLIEVEEDEVY
ncbi:hypothetical protein [Terrisporobacter sp.]|uniref:hypothetical protein n=1 Tax=Terrisporobacter sp. TaxID=1965305 RepID=UPI002602A1D4|nr:hypothetical protein [Terrisporobacter sp.]